jgi:hypothetical protein
VVHHVSTVHKCCRRSVWLNQYARQFIPIIALLVLRGFVGVGGWIVSKCVAGGDDMLLACLQRRAEPAVQSCCRLVPCLAGHSAAGVGRFSKKKDAMTEMAEELGAHRAKEFNVGVNPNKLGGCHFARPGTAVCCSMAAAEAR